MHLSIIHPNTLEGTLYHSTLPFKKTTPHPIIPNSLPCHPKNKHRHHLIPRSSFAKFMPPSLSINSHPLRGRRKETKAACDAMQCEELAPRSAVLREI
jgi:hypothetical protein